MKLTYIVQLIISVAIIVLANILTGIFGFWLYRSIGFGICGLIWIIHPVAPNGVTANRQTVLWTRLAGVILILMGIFTRVHV